MVLSLSFITMLSFVRSLTIMNSLLPCTCRTIARQVASTSKAALAPGSRKRVSTSVNLQYPRQARSLGSQPQTSSQDEVEPWYTREVPHFAQPAKQTLEAPPPPSTIPTFLHPLWTHLFESPFLDQSTISFIDERALDEASAEEGEEADRSVTSFVDWKIVASLRNGRERGIRGACDGVRIAVRMEIAKHGSQLTLNRR